jgi:tetratricopeptide (TPR) repeat protein
MSHSVLVETAWRFVEEFYQALADGVRVGQAMLAGQRRLHDDTFRLHIFGAGELHLQDWFVPVLFQEKEDPQLFRRVPSRAAMGITEALRSASLGKLPDEPATGFVGRSRELLALQRLLRPQHSVGRIANPSYLAADLPRWAVVRGNGGEGKTALAVELARWLVRSQQMDRAAFVSVEIDTNAAAVVNALGLRLAANHQLATKDNLDAAVQQVERALEEQSTVLVVDNMESLLRPPYAAEDEALAADAADDLREILDLCQRLCRVGGTRIVFTSREALPAPFADQRHRIEFTRLAKDDAVKLVERALQQGGVGGRIEDATREAIEDLVAAVQCHARTLALLAQPLRKLGVERTRQSLVSLMADMHRRFPQSHEQSLFASVDLSLQRLSAENRERVGVLGVFHGELDLDVLHAMMEWEQNDVATLASELIQTGLATLAPYNHLRLDPALCPYLRARLSGDQRQELETRWVEAMRAFVGFLVGQRSQEVQLAATLTLLELPNLMVLLDRVSTAGDPEATIDLAADLFRLLQSLGKLRLLEKVGAVRDAAAKLLGEYWSHAQFQSQRTRIEQLLAVGRLTEALDGASGLHQRSLAAGESAYTGADYDIAMACILLGRVLHSSGATGQALPLLQDAERRFDAVERQKPGCGAARMASVSLTEQGDCLQHLGRLDEAVEAYEETIRLDEARNAFRDVAIGKVQLGTVRNRQRRYPQALAAYEEARQIFENLGEPATVSAAWHQIGMVHQESGQPEAAERAYRESLAISVRLGDVAGQADTLNQLGNLYDDVLGRWRKLPRSAVKPRTSTCRSETRRRRGALAATSPTRFASSAATAKPARRSAARSTVRNSSAMPPNRGRHGPSSPTSSWLTANPQPPPRLVRRPSSCSWPIAATAVRITHSAVGCAPPSPRRCWPATSRRLLTCSPLCGVDRISPPTCRRCSAPSKPSSAAAAIPRWPRIPTLTTRTPPKSSCCSKPSPALAADLTLPSGLSRNNSGR